MRSVARVSQQLQPIRQLIAEHLHNKTLAVEFASTSDVLQSRFSGVTPHKSLTIEN